MKYRAYNRPSRKHEEYILRNTHMLCILSVPYLDVSF